jgi:hypothetical protein
MKALIIILLIAAALFLCGYGLSHLLNGEPPAGYERMWVAADVCFGFFFLIVVGGLISIGILIGTKFK